MRKCSKCGNVFDFESSLIDKCLSCQTDNLNKIMLEFSTAVLIFTCACFMTSYNSRSYYK